MPPNGFFLSSCFHPKQILACEPYSSRHNKLCAVWNTGPGRQAARRAMCRKMSVARQLSFSLSLPRSGRLLLYSPSIKNSHCQALLQPQMGIKLTSHLQNALPGGAEGRKREGVKDKQARRGEISESVRRWLINKVVGWGVRRLDTADWYSTEIACHSRSASLHNRCWSGRAEGSLYPWGTFRIKNTDLWHHFLPTQQYCRGPLEVFRLLTLFFFSSVLFRAVVAFLKLTEVSNNVVPLFTSSTTTSHFLSLSLSPHNASASRGSEAITQAHFNFLISAGIDGPAAAGQKAKSIILHYRTAGVKSRSPYDCRKPLRSRKQTPDLCTLIYLPFSP